MELPAVLRSPIYLFVSVAVSAFSLAIALVLVAVAYLAPGEGADIAFLVRLDFIFCGVFFLDFVFRVGVLRVRYRWWEYLVDIGSFIPPVGFVSSETRLLRLVRLARVIAILRRILNVNARDHSPTALAVVCFAVAMLMGFMVGFRSIEPNTFDSYMNAFYYTVVTSSTVGYGDLYPKSELGRIVSLGLIFLGIVAFSCMTALLAAKISGTSNELQEVKENQEKILRLLQVRDRRAGRAKLR